jgi:hypothetical protein
MQLYAFVFEIRISQLSGYWDPYSSCIRNSGPEIYQNCNFKEVDQDPDDISGLLGVIEMKGLNTTGPMYFVIGSLYPFLHHLTLSCIKKSYLAQTLSILLHEMLSIDTSNKILLLLYEM